MSDHYAKAGVDIEAGNQFVKRISAAAQATHGPEVLAGLGGFAAHFALDTHNYTQPTLVSATDGVGTKLRVAIDTGRFEGIGADLVAMCVNDLACSGATPLFFLDYFATGKLHPEQHAGIVESIANACQHVGCALVGGETAEMPGMYHGNDFDLAGFAVGVVERENIITGAAITPGNIVLGIASSGYHSNGYSLVRKVLQDANLAYSDTFPGTEHSVADMLLTPTTLYSPILSLMRETAPVLGIAHITGGGLVENLPRILPEHCAATINLNSWDIPTEHAFIQQQTDMSSTELLTVLNAGIGCTVVVDQQYAQRLCDVATKTGHTACPIGEITTRTGQAIRLSKG